MACRHGTPELKRSRADIEPLPLPSYAGRLEFQHEKSVSVLLQA